jgi:kynurenine 3-monooxygenase
MSAGTAKFTVIGAGLGGALMAIYLARAGHTVEVYEKRPDPRTGPASEGRSINLAISSRGIHALGQVGLADRVLAASVPMRGRMMHALDGRLTFQPYGTRADHVLNSVSRTGLNVLLLDAAEKDANVRLVFGKRCTGVDLATATASFVDVESGEPERVEGDVLVGADGAFSPVRQQLQRLDRFDCEQAYLGHGYKELTMPARPDGGFALAPNALHIWPRGESMMIALPNQDGSFTCTIFWPFEGSQSFAEIRSGTQALAHFRAIFPDAVPLMPTLARDYVAKEAASLVTIRCRPWSYRDRVVLLGDACHAVVPFYGQGANASFEDCVVLRDCLAEHSSDRARAFTAYHERRKPHTDALAALSLANFVEMRARTASTAFLVGRRMEAVAHRLAPRWFVPLYTLVTFTRTPYATAIARAEAQRRALRRLGGALLALLSLLVAAAVGLGLAR